MTKNDDGQKRGSSSDIHGLGDARRLWVGQGRLRSNRMVDRSIFQSLSDTSNRFCVLQRHCRQPATRLPTASCKVSGFAVAAVTVKSVEK